MNRLTKFQQHTAIFLLMMLPPIALYFAARGNAPDAALWALLLPVVLGSLWALTVK